MKLEKSSKINQHRRLNLCIAAMAFVPFFFFSNSESAEAQAVANAKMHGTVTDSTGAIVPNATVTAVQAESGATVTAVTSDSGSYVLPNLPVGSYNVKIAAPGFQTYSRTGILLQVSNDAEIDAPLTIGATDTVITVEGGVRSFRHRTTPSPPSWTKSVPSIFR